MPPRLFCAGVQRTNWTPTEEEKWDLLRLANTKGKLMKALGVITRAPKMLEYLAQQRSQWTHTSSRPTTP